MLNRCSACNFQTILLKQQSHKLIMYCMSFEVMFCDVNIIVSRFWTRKMSYDSELV